MVLRRKEENWFRESCFAFQAKTALKMVKGIYYLFCMAKLPEMGAEEVNIEKKSYKLKV